MLNTGTRNFYFFRRPMHISVPAFVNGVNIIVATIALLAVGGATIAGLQGVGSLLIWRWIKFLSGLCGLVGLMFWMFNFEGAVRKGFEKLPPARILSFGNVKLISLQKMLEACADTSTDMKSMTCGQYTEIYGSLNWLDVRDGKKIATYTMQIPAPGVAEFQRHVNAMIDEVNVYQASPEDQEPRDSGSMRREKLLLIGVVFLIAAAAGTIGDAAFQLRQALNEARRLNEPSPADGSS